jgi:hypothetical protein
LPRRKDRPPLDARDADHAVLERLAQGPERGTRKLRQLVQEESAAVCKRLDVKVEAGA